MTTDDRNSRSQSFHAQVADGLSYNPVDRARPSLSPADLLSRSLANDLTHNQPTMGDRALFGSPNAAANAAQSLSDMAFRQSSGRSAPGPSAPRQGSASATPYASPTPPQRPIAGPSYEDCLRLARRLDVGDPIAPTSWSEQIASNLASNDGEDWAQSRRAQERTLEREGRIQWKAKYYMSSPTEYSRDLARLDGESKPLNRHAKTAFALGGVALLVLLTGGNSPVFGGAFVLLILAALVFMILSMNT